MLGNIISVPISKRRLLNVYLDDCDKRYGKRTRVVPGGRPDTIVCGLLSDLPFTEQTEVVVHIFAMLLNSASKCHFPKKAKRGKFLKEK